MLVLFNKPWGVLCQFRDSKGRPTLADYLSQPRIYPAGRLDRDSEGLLALTDNGSLQNRIAEPARKLAKTYWVQVEGRPLARQLDALRCGVELRDGEARAVDARLLPGPPPGLWPRDPPVRQRRHIPTAWLEVILDEGRNRQLRRMTAAAGLPTLRLIRCAIGPWTLDGLRAGDWRQADASLLD